jgi:hypothetical protein
MEKAGKMKSPYEYQSCTVNNRYEIAYSDGSQASTALVLPALEFTSRATSDLVFGTVADLAEVVTFVSAAIGTGIFCVCATAAVAGSLGAEFDFRGRGYRGEERKYEEGFE